MLTRAPVRIVPLQQLLTHALLSGHRGTGCVKSMCLLPPRVGRPPIVAFFGTRNWADVVVDVDIVGTSWGLTELEGARIGLDDNDVRVHRGFARRALGLYTTTRLQSFLRTYAHHGVVLTGYSLGGAIAPLVAFMCITDGIVVESVHLFGSPPFASDGFTSLYENCGLQQRTWRYVIPDDPVCQIPLYTHVGTQVVVSNVDATWGWQAHNLDTYDSNIGSATTAMQDVRSVLMWDDDDDGQRVSWNIPFHCARRVASSTNVLHRGHALSMPSLRWNSRRSSQ
jgi:hypothetical protein